MRNGWQHSAVQLDSAGNCNKAVSYTHLDVYKRQVLHYPYAVDTAAVDKCS